MNGTVFQSSLLQETNFCVTNASLLRDVDTCDPICGLEPDECEFVRTWKHVNFSITLVFDVITLFTLLFLGLYRSVGQRIFLNILISNIGEAISVLMNDGVYGMHCTIAAFGVQYFGFVLFTWVCGLTVYLYIILVKKPKSIKKTERNMTGICWGLPIANSMIPFFTGHFGPSGAFCWVDDHVRFRNVLTYSPIGAILRFAVWWVPVILGVILNGATFFFIICRALRGSFTGTGDVGRRQHRSLVQRYLNPLAGYGIVSIILHLLMVSDRIKSAITQSSAFVFKVCHMVSFASYGSVLCILFYLTNRRIVFNKRQWLSRYRNLIRSKNLKDVLRFSRTVSEIKLPQGHRSSRNAVSELYTVAESEIERDTLPHKEGITNAGLSATEVSNDSVNNSAVSRHQIVRQASDDVIDDGSLSVFQPQQVDQFRTHSGLFMTSMGYQTDSGHCSYNKAEYPYEHASDNNNEMIDGCYGAPDILANIPISSSQLYARKTLDDPQNDERGLTKPIIAESPNLEDGVVISVGKLEGKLDNKDTINSTQIRKRTVSL